MVNLSKVHAHGYWHLTVCAYEMGHLRFTELLERGEVLAKLLDENFADSGTPCDPESEARVRESEAGSTIGIGGGEKEDNPPFVEFIPSGLQDKWVFTISDPDPHPSVPHGHLRNKNNPTPKLDPYVGRALRLDGREDGSLRLTKREMVVLWSDPHFQSHCLHQIGWFDDRNRDFKWRVRDPTVLPEPWRRYSNWSKYYRD